MAESNTSSFSFLGGVAELKDDKLVIVIDMKNNGGPSSTGKSVKIASTTGNVAIPMSDGAKLGLNVYRPT